MSKVYVSLFCCFLLLMGALANAQDTGGSGFGGNSSVNMPPVNSNNGDPLGGVSSNNENIGQYIIDWILRGASFTDPENTLFGAISMILNSVTLAFALVILLKHGFQFATLTATKGVPGGSQLPGGTITIRTSLAIAMLAPIIGNGFSPIQATIQEATRFGAYIGDEGVKAASDYLTAKSGDDTTSHTIVPAHLEDTTKLIWHVVLNESCQQAIIGKYRNDLALGLITNDSPVTFEVEANKQYIDYKWGWKSPPPVKPRSIRRRSSSEAEPNHQKVCGTVRATIPAPLQGKVSNDGTTLQISVDNETDAVYKQQLLANHNALLQLREDIKPVAQQLFSDQVLLREVDAMRYMDGYTASDIDSLYKVINDRASELKVLIPTYGQLLLDADKQYLATLRTQGIAGAQYIHGNGPTDNQGRTWDEALQAQGFAALGAYYWTQLKTTMAVADLQKHLVHDNDLPYVYAATPYKDDTSKIQLLEQIKKTKSFNTHVKRLRLLEAAYKTLKPNQQAYVDLSNVEQSDSAGKIGDGEGFWRSIGLSGQPGQLVLNFIQSRLEDNTNNDLIVNLMAIGVFITSITESLILILLAALGFKAMTSGGAGAIVGFFTNGATNIAISALLPIIIMGILIGLTFQYLLPAIPLIKWLVSLQSWGIMMFIAMIYGPIWMMSTAAATNEDWVNDKMQDGFIVIAELILRPLLMVAGFYAAMMLMAVANIGAKMAFSYTIPSPLSGQFHVMNTPNSGYLR